MPPRFAYWTILAGGLPTAFRAAEKAELLPTFHRIKEKHPDAEMKWFARGKLWASPEDAQRQLHDTRRGSSGARPREARGKDWRPGGEHRDPRQRFKDAQKKQNQDRRKQRWDLQHRDSGAGERDQRPPDQRNRNERPPGARFRAEAKPRERPHGDPLRNRQTKGSRQGSDWKRSGSGKAPRPRDERPWSGKPRSAAPPRRDRQDRGSSQKAPRSDLDGGQRWDKPRDESRRPPSANAGARPTWNPRPPNLDSRGSDRPRPSLPRPAPHGDKLRDELPPRTFKPAQGRGRARTGPSSRQERGQWEERTPPPPSRPPRPDREPRPDVEPGPEAPPRPNEPAVPPPEPPERGGKK